MERFEMNFQDNSLEGNNELMEKVGKLGRLLTYTVMSKKLSERANGGTGARNITDGKISGFDILKTGDFQRGAFDFGVNNLTIVSEKNNISAIVTIAPIIDVDAIYETERIETKGFLGKVKVEEKKVYKGEKKTPVSMKRFNESSGDDEAYKILYYLGETEGKEFRDPTTNRTGGALRAAMILPKDIALEVFEKIEQNPESINDFLKELDPEMMSELEPFMPKPDKFLVVPEGEMSKAIGNTYEANPAYIK